MNRYRFVNSYPEPLHPPVSRIADDRSVWSQHGSQSHKMDFGFVPHPGLPNDAAKPAGRYILRGLIPQEVGPKDVKYRQTVNNIARRRIVNVRWVIPGGPACTAEYQPHGAAPIHNTTFQTRGDYRRPTLALKAYNTASIDVPSMLDSVRQQVMQALFGGGK